MRQCTRREMLGAAAATIAAGAFAPRLAAAAAKKRRFTMDLVCGAVGIRANQREAILLAQAGGFESVQPVPRLLAELQPAELVDLLEMMKLANLTWGVAGLPVDFRGDEAAFRSSLIALAPLAEALRKAAGRDSGHGSVPHPDLTYRANFDLHARRLREVAKVLSDHGQRLGLEYVGPKTSWTKHRFPFIHTMVETKELLAEIGQDNVGVALDSWHWYTASETAEDVLSLRGRDVVSCHLNDVPAGIPVDEQIDNRRALPAATGVIDLKAFLGALVEIGFDGPVYAEPFDKELSALDNEPALQAVSASMHKAFALLESP